MSKPFLRWAGGKSKIVKHLISSIPDDFNSYWEPFLGAGALYFAIKPKTAYLFDINKELICCYKWIKKNPQLIYKYLSNHKKKSSKEYYYQIRRQFNKQKSSAAQAARFLYLNRTCFNGIYRVNLKGEFNVPYGYKEPPIIPSKIELLVIAKALEKAIIEDIPYDDPKIIQETKPYDFVYLDPPYPPLNGTSFFQHYSTPRFSWEDQKKVSELAKTLSKKNCMVMISNSDQPRIRNLYRHWKISRLPVTRWISANGERQIAYELLITNY